MLIVLRSINPHGVILMKKRTRYISSLLSSTYQEWSRHDAQTEGAALSYFTVLSLAPLLVIAVSIAGLVFGKQAVQTHIVDEMRGLVGSGADAIKTMLSHAQSPKAGIIASVIGFVVLLYGASGVFSQLRKALNRTWNIQPRETAGWFGMIRQQFFSFAMVVGIGFLLLVSLLITAFVAGIGQFAGNYLPVAVTQIANQLISLVVITFVFALIYRFVPEQTLPWRRLWPGAIATAVLFTIGKYLLGVYLGRASVASPYGAAGSLVVLLVWVYYSSQLFLFGAEFTRIYSCQAAGVCLNTSPVAAASDSPPPAASRQTADESGNQPAPAGKDAEGQANLQGVDMPETNEPSFTKLFQESVSAIQEIIRSEFRLAKTEVKEEAGKAGKSAAELAGGSVLALFAFGLVLLAAVFALAIAVPLWLAFLLIGVLVGAVAGIVVLKGRRHLRMVHPVPEKTVSSVKENLEWTKRRAG